MQKNQVPALVPVPFADSGQKNTIPTASQAAVTLGAASYADGFPAITLTSARNGGVPPSGKDFNGILNAITNAIRWGNAGGQYSYNAAFATDAKVGGYPSGAVLMRADGTGHWINTADNNQSDPDASDGTSANWVPGYNYGPTLLPDQTGGTITLTPAQAAKNRIVVSGALVNDLQIVVPTWKIDWTVVNATTGNYAVNITTAAGTGVNIPQGTAALVYGDGASVKQHNISVTTPSASDNSAKPANTSWIRTNIQSLVSDCITAVATVAGFNKITTANASAIIFPSWLGGLIVQYGTSNFIALSDVTTKSITFPVTFVSAVWFSSANLKTLSDSHMGTIGTSPSNSGMSAGVIFNDINSVSSAPFTWFAIGY